MSADLRGDPGAVRRGGALFGAQRVLVHHCMAKLGYRCPITVAGPAPEAGLTTADVVDSAAPPSYTQGSASPARQPYVRGAAPARRTSRATGADPSGGAPSNQAARTGRHRGVRA